MSTGAKVTTTTTSSLSSSVLPPTPVRTSNQLENKIALLKSKILQKKMGKEAGSSPPPGAESQAPARVPPAVRALIAEEQRANVLCVCVCICVCVCVYIYAYIYIHIHMMSTEIVHQCRHIHLYVHTYMRYFLIACCAHHNKPM